MNPPSIAPIRMLPWLVLCGAIVIGSATRVGIAAAADQPAAVDFAKQVYPILKRSCFECHGAEKQAADLRLDQRADALQSGMIVKGAADESELLRRVMLPLGHDEVMPAIGDPLPNDQVETLRRWIDQGAQWPAEFVAQQHWAYVAPQRSPVPVVHDEAWTQSPIDHFVLRQLEDAGLQPAPLATPEKRIRRLFLDLIGLPPTVQEVQDFVRDPSTVRYERIVDRLLASPQFGERWARPWLDLARYADSHGFQRDNFRDVWAYRDWVVTALNDDMPYDQFTIEQIAGDLLPDATESQKIATGFHRCTPTNVEAGSLPEETRIEQVIDRVNTTGAVWLGTTLECCQCHDHKYDPFSTQEYYQLLAYFNNTVAEADRANPNQPSSIRFDGPSMPLSDPQRDSVRAQLIERINANKQQQAERKSSFAADLEHWANDFRQSIIDSPQTHRFQVDGFESQGSTDSFVKLEDGSILIQGGDPPDTDEYKIQLSGKLSDVIAIRLDVLLDDSLPGQGPGRNERRNFVLNEFTVDHVTAADQSNRLQFASASASFSQRNFDVGGAMDGDLKTGWAISPQQGRPHWAMFKLQAPLQINADHQLRLSMVQQFGKSLTIGRLMVSAVTGNVDGEPVPQAIAMAASKLSDQWSQQDRQALIDFRTRDDAELIRLASSINQLQSELNAVAAPTTLVMVEQPTARSSAVFLRGDYRQPGQTVQPATPSILHACPDGPADRLTLAKWLVSPDNPLVARVAVNRWWREIFGEGIVTTLEDFGIKGESPSHPELLDWLAVEFVDQGWSMKKLIKSIVTSSVYQQSSEVRYDLREIDSANRMLARGPRFRMDAETIRDNALAIAGLLCLDQAGPSIRPYQPDGVWSKVGGEAYDYQISTGNDRYRRGIYVVVKRGSPYPSFINFDATARLACTVKRSRTNTPLQALTLLNDPVYVEAAQALSARIAVDGRGRSNLEQLQAAFQRCTARQPTASELATLQHLYQRQSQSGDPMYGVATVLLNLHETITKD